MPMTTKDREKLYAELDKRSMRPARTRPEVGGATTLTWYVDDDDDRFVEVRDSVRGRKFLLVVRNNDYAMAKILNTAVDIAGLVNLELKRLVRKKS